MRKRTLSLGSRSTLVSLPADNTLSRASFQFFIKLFFLLLFVLFFLAKPVSAAWANTSFDRCMNITITNSGSETLTDFPAYINLTYDSDMLPDFKDLRFYNASCGNDGNLMAYEIENYTTKQRNNNISILQEQHSHW